MKKHAFVRIMMMLFLLLTSSSMFAAGVQYLRITEKGGTIYEIPLSEYPIINVENNVLKVGASTIIYMEIALEDIENYTLAFPAAPAKKDDPSLDDEVTGITNVKFSGMAPGTVINVYAPNGKLEGKVAADENGRVSTDLGSFGKGVHILRTPNGSIKVLNK